MTDYVFVFWLVSLFTLVSGLSVILVTNPIYSALSLALTMLGIASLFVTLNAFFLAGVQLIVYAGAVMVLFVMVLMLFDLKHETKAFSRGAFSGFLKIASAGVLAGLIAGAIYMSRGLFIEGPSMKDTGMATSVALGNLIFSRYVFGFEVLGVLLLIVAIGAVALARSKGGTHAK